MAVDLETGDLATVDSSSPPEPTFEDLIDKATDGEEPERLGPLLDLEDKKKVRQAILKNWKDQDNPLSYQLCEVEQAEYWRQGERWVYIKPSDDDQQHEIWRPSGIDRIGKLPDKVDQLVRRFVAQLLVDKAVLVGEPENGSEAFQKSAQLVTRIFEAEGGVGGWNFTRLLEGAVDISCTQKSSYAHVITDPEGGGERAVTVLASPLATHFDPQNPEACLMEPGPPLPMPPKAPPILGQPPMPPLAPQPGPPVRTAKPVTRYLSKDFSLTEHETAETQKRWVPWPIPFLVGFRNVRFLPEWCRGADDPACHGLMVADYLSIGMLKKLYPDTVGEMDDVELRKLIAWQGLPTSQLLPLFCRDPKLVGTKLQDGVVPDDAIALCVWEYHPQSPVYPKGAVICVSGAEEPIHSETLEVLIEQPDGSEVPRVLGVPVAQCRCINDWIGMRPGGQSLVTKIGPWAELFGQQWSAVMDWLERWNHPHQFLPLGSSVQPNQMAMRTGEPILTNPNGEPHTELVPAIPADVKEFLDRAEEGMDKESFLNEAGEGLVAPNINSDRQAQTTLGEALTALSSIHDNTTHFLITLGNILLERLQAYVTMPMAVEYVGDDGAYKADEWRRVDLVGVKGLKLKRGTFTMQSPERKKLKLMQDVGNKIIPLEDAIDQMADASRSEYGLEDDPVRQRIKRQISACIHHGTPFDRNPVDLLPAVAHARFRELARTSMGTEWTRADAAKNPQVAKMLFGEMDAMRQASGQFTLAESTQHATAAADQAAARDANTKVKIEQGKNAAQGEKSVQETLHELRADLILLATKAGLDPQSAAAYAAAELETGVLGQVALSLGVIPKAAAMAPVAAAPPLPPHLRLVRPSGGAMPAHTPAQMVSRPAIPQGAV